MKTLEFGRVGLVALFFNPLAALAATDTWDGNNGVGSNNNLSNGVNWLDDTAPADDLANTDLIFATANKPAPNVSAAIHIHSLTFDNTSTAFTFGGTTLSIGTGGIVNNDADLQSFNTAIDFSGVTSATINAASGGFAFINTVSLPTNSLTIDGNFNTTFVGFVGNSGLTKTGGGTMSWTIAPAITFNVTVNNGTLNINTDGAADVFNSNTTIAIGAPGIVNMNESVTLDGGQLTRATGAQLNLAAGKTFTIQNGADAVITGSFINNTASTVTVTGAGSTLSTSTIFGTIGGATTNVAAGGSVSAGTGFNIATNGNGTVSVIGSGSSVSGGTLNLASNGGTGSLTFDTNSTGTFTDMKIDVASAASTSGTLTIEGGANVTSSGFSVATTVGNNSGTVNVMGTGAFLGIDGSAATNIGAASTNTATLNVFTTANFSTSTGLMTVFPTATVNITGGTFHGRGSVTLDGGQIAVSGASGQMTFDAGTTFTVQNGGDASFENSHSIVNASTTSVTGAGSTLTTGSGMAVNGGGSLSVLAGGSVVSGSVAPLTIGSLGSGTILVDGAGASLTATGAILGQGGGTGSLSFTGGSTGSIGSSVQVDAGSGASTGTLNVSTGSMVTATALFIASTAGPNTGSVTINGSGSALSIANTTTIGAGTSNTGTLNVQNSGTFNSGTSLTSVNATGTIAISGGNYTSHGNLTLNGGQLTRATGSVFGIDAGKTFTVQAGGDAIFTGNLVNSTASTITVTGAGSTLSDTINLVIQGGAALNILAGASVTSGSSISIGTGVGDGSVVVDGTGSSLTSTIGTLALSDLGFNGSVAFTNGSTGSFALGLSLSNSSTAGSDSVLSVQSGSTLTAGSLDLGTFSMASNTATVTVTGANSKLILTGPNTSSVGNNFAAGSSMLTIESGATLTTSTAAFNINNTGEVDILPGGTLNGPADFGGGGPLVIAGNYSPGSASGANQTTSVTFAQNMNFQSTTAIAMEIGGTTAGTQYDQLVFNGAGTPQVTWNGILGISLISGFVPQLGNSFNIFDFDFTRDAGAFTTVSLPPLTSGLFWRLEQLYSTGIIRVSLTSDTYAQWQAGYGTGAFGADDDKDGIPNGVEFLLGTNPKAAYSAGQNPFAELKPIYGTNTTATFIFKIPEDPGVDAHYRVQGSDDLANWTTIASKDGGSAWSGTAAVTTGGTVAGLNGITVVETLAANTAKRFHRLRAIAP